MRAIKEAIPCLIPSQLRVEVEEEHIRQTQEMEVQEEELLVNPIKVQEHLVKDMLGGLTLLFKKIRVMVIQVQEVEELQQ